MTKYLVVAFAAMLMLIFATPEIAQAHVLKVDGSIGAVLHINPDDNPTTEGPIQYILSFSGEQTFSLPRCNCDMHVLKNGKQIAMQSLAATSRTVSDDTYTFQTPDVYTLEVTGSPKTPGLFQSFTLDYDVRVTNGQAHMQPFPPFLYVGIGMAVGLVLLGSFASMYNDESSAVKKEKQS